MAEADNVVKLPSTKILQGLINKSDVNRSKRSTLAGEIGQAISDAVDKHNLHAGAFKLAAKLQRMDAVKLYAFLTHFDDYRDKLALDAQAGAALGLDEDGKGADGHQPDDDSDRDPDDKVGEAAGAAIN